MASITQTASGWRAQVYVKGTRDSKVFDKKTDAVKWAAARETELRAIAQGRGGEVKTLLDAFKRYAEEIAPRHRGEKNELVRLQAFQGPDHGLPLKRRLADISKADLVAWRDRRAKINKPASVTRDMTLLRSVFEAARVEWEWIPSNPMEDVKRPPKPAHRDRLIAGWETRRVLRALGHSKKPRSVSSAIASAFLFALATGMRVKEVCTLRWEDVYENYGTAKNVKSRHVGVHRDVPFSPVAKRLIERMKGWDEETVFGITPKTLDVLFRRAKETAGVSGFTFHDARHTAATRLARQLSVFELCRMFGWKRMDQALTYYNETASQIAKKLTS